MDYKLIGTFGSFYICERCGAVVYRRGVHDEWHGLNDNPRGTVTVDRAIFAQTAEG